METEAKQTAEIEAEETITHEQDQPVASQEEQPATPPKPAPHTPPKKVKKHDIAKMKIAQAEETIHSVDSEIEACMKQVDEDLASFKEAEEVLLAQGLRPAREKLKSLGVTEKLIESAPTPKVDLEDPELSTVEIQKISSGRATGLFWGLLGGAAALGGWCYTATQALGLPLIPQKFPDMERINAVLGWTAKQLGQGDNVAVGGVIVGGGVLVIIGGIYALITSLRGSKNLKVAEKIEADTEFYCTKKEECKTQMKRVREHIADAHKMVDKYTVLLAEQNGALDRALFIEEAEGYDDLHPRTKQTVQTLQHLADEVETFLETPMAEHGILSKKGIEILERVNKSAEEHIKKLYEG